MRPGKERKEFDLNSREIVDLAEDANGNPGASELIELQGALSTPDTADILEAEEMFHDEPRVGSTGVASSSTKRLTLSPKEHRVFNSRTQDRIAEENTKRIHVLRAGVKVLAGALVVAFVSLLAAYLKDTRRNPNQVLTGNDRELGDNAIAITDEFSSHIQEAKRIAIEFIEADSLNERLLHVRYPQKVAPLMKNDPARDWDAPLQFGDPKPYLAGYVRDHFFTGIYVEDERFRPHPIDMELRVEREPNNGRYLIDWESFAEYNEISWERILDERASNRDYRLRAIIRLDDYYNYGFTEELYQCFRITDRRQLYHLYVYARKRGWVEEAFRELFRDVVVTEGTRSALQQYVQIEIRFPETSLAEPMAELTTLIAPHWFTLDPDFDGTEAVNPSAILGELGSMESVPFSPTQIDWRNRNKEKTDKIR